MRGLVLVFRVFRLEAAEDGDVNGHYDWHAVHSLLDRLLLHRTFDQTPEASWNC